MPKCCSETPVSKVATHRTGQYKFLGMIGIWTEAGMVLDRCVCLRPRAKWKVWGTGRNSDKLGRHTPLLIILGDHKSPGSIRNLCH